MRRLVFFVGLVQFGFLVHGQGWRTCAPLRVNGESVNCVCNITYCDDFPMFSSIPANSAIRYDSSKSGKRFAQSTVTFANGVPPSGAIIVQVNTSQQRQTINGFGTAFTDAATLMIARLSKQTRLNVLRTYYSDVGGIGYSFARVPLGSCDFSTREYSYDDVDSDFDLTNFALADEDTIYKIPSLLDAQSLTSTKLWLYSSPWSPPKWMKTSGSFTGGSLIDNATIRQSYANYYIKFFQAYKAAGLEFWGLTVQNEPNNGNFWQTMTYTPEDEGSFVASFLGPTLQANDLTKNLKLMILDHNREFLSISHWPFRSLGVEGASQYVSGIAVHWYADDYTSPIDMAETHALFPEKFLLYTEACTGPGVVLGSWTRGEKYAKSIIDNLNNWSTGWVDWNFALNPQGGPNWVGNYNDAPIIVNFETDSFQKQPMFYNLGHFSKLVTRGSIWVEAKTAQTLPANVLLIAFIDPAQANRRIVVVSNQADTPQKVYIQDVADPNGQYLVLDVEEHSIVTVVYNAF